MMNDVQQRVADFVREHGLETDVSHRVLDTASELGEVAKEVLAGSRYGRTRFKPGPTWQDELGDVLFSLLCVANSTGVDAGAAVDGALRKYERRLRQRGTAASAETSRARPGSRSAKR